MLRHPADAIRSYRDVRYELAYSSDWAESHARKEYTYSYEGPMEHFYWWKQDGGFIQEMKLWSWFIDFWMENGISRNKEHELVRTSEVSYNPKQYKIVGENTDIIIGYDTNVRIGDDTSQPQYEDTSQPPIGEDTNVVVGTEFVEYSDNILYYEDAFNVTYDENGTVVTNETVQVPVYEPIYQDVYKQICKYGTRRSINKIFSLFLVHCLPFKHQIIVSLTPPNSFFFDYYHLIYFASYRPIGVSSALPASVSTYL